MKNGIKGCLVVLVSLLIVIVVAIAMCGGEDKLPEGLTDDEKLVAEVVGVKTNYKEFESRFIDVTSDSVKFVAVLVGDEGWTTGTMRYSLLSKSAKLIEKVFAERPELLTVKLIWQLPLRDKLGNEELGEVMNIVFARETADKIKWENFNCENLPELAYIYWQHTALTK